MSGNQESRVRLPTWRCSDFNAAIPIKKRKYLVQQQLPATEEAGSSVLNNSNKQGDASVGGSGLDSSVADEKQNMVGGFTTNVGEPVPSLPSVSVANGDKAGSTGSMNFDQIRVKVEEPNFTVHSSPLAGVETPSRSNIPGSSMGKLPVGADKTGMNTDQTVLKTHDIVRETCSKDNLRGELLTEASSGASAVPMLGGCETKKTSPHWEKKESTSLNLSLTKGVCDPGNTDSVPTCAKSGNHSGVSRSNWDLNTTMDAWEDNLDRKARVKTSGAFLNSNRSLPDIEPSSFCDTAVIAKSVSEKRKESVEFKSPTGTLSQFERQVKPTCSLSLGLSSYPPIEKPSSVSSTTLDARAACTRFSRPSRNVNLRTVKSEVIEESIRQETDNVQVCPIGLSISGVKQEAVSRFSQGNSPSSGILKPVVPVSIKTEPHNFTRSEVFTREDGKLRQAHTPILHSHEALDLPTSSTPNQKDQCITYSNDSCNAPMSLSGMTMKQGVQSYSGGKLKESSGQSCSAADGKLCDVPKHGRVHMTSSGHGNLSASGGVNVTSLTEERTLNDCKTSISKDIPHKSRGTDEVSVSHEGKGILSGKELGEDLHRYGFKSDCSHDLSRVIKVQDGNEIANAECGGSENEQRDINHVEEKGSLSALLGNTGNKHIKECSVSSATNNFKKYHVDESHLKLVETASTEVQIQRVTPEQQSGIFDGSAEYEGQMVRDSEQSTHQIIYASEGMSGVSTVSGGNVNNTEIIDNRSPISYKAENSTIDYDPSTAEFSEGSQNRIINLAQVSNKSPIETLDASGSYAPLRMERDRLPDCSLEPRKYARRGSDDSFSRERYHGKVMRSPKFNYMPDRRRFSDQTESNTHDRDTKNFEFDNYGNTRRGGRGGAYYSNFRRGRRSPNDEGTPFSHSFARRPPTFSFTNRGTRNKEETSEFSGYRDGENATRGSQCNDTEPMFTSPHRPYRGRSGYFARGQTKFLNAPKRDFPRYRSRSPTRSRERSPGPSSSFRNRSQEDFSGNTEFPNRRSPSGYRMEKISSPDHSGYSRENVARRHSSPPYSHRPSNTGRGRGYHPRGRGYVRGRGYGRAGFPFRNPSDRVIHRNQGNLDPRERVNYNDDFFQGPNHSERFGGERRRFGYSHDGTSSFRTSFNIDGCAPSNVENDPDAVRLGQDPDTEIEGGSFMEIDGNNNDSVENASESTKNMEGEETSKNSNNWRRDELGGGDGF